jgi:hypothetical protein
VISNQEIRPVGLEVLRMDLGLGMPDRRLTLLVQLCLQNADKFPQRKRKLFAEIRDEEIAAIEREIGRVLSPPS